MDNTEHFNVGYATAVIPTDAKRVIIPLPQGIIGQDVEYVEWDGKPAQGNGFLFQNATDKRAEFIQADGGIFIGHEGECPEGPNGEMILRSQAVENYLKKHPDAFSDAMHIQETILYLQTHVFKHASDPAKWDKNAVSDIWASNQKWLKDNFNESDIYDSAGNLRSVISASKKAEKEYTAVYFGPNFSIEGLGETSDRGSYAVRQPDGSVNLCVAEAFEKTYQRLYQRKIENFHGGDVFYPKRSSRYVEPSFEPKLSVSLNDRISARRKDCAMLQTPVFRVLGAALCDYIEEHQNNTISVELEINSLIAHDRNQLSLVSSSPKTELLRPLLEERIINDNGEIINPQAFANSDLIRNYKGKNIDLTGCKTITKLASQNQLNQTDEHTI